MKGHVGVGAGDSAVQSHSMGGVRGRAEGRTHTHTHTQDHPQERTRECRTYPFGDLPLKKRPIN